MDTLIIRGNYVSTSTSPPPHNDITRDTSAANTVRLEGDQNLNKIIVKLREREEGRAKGRLRKVTQRSFLDYRWWMVDILSLMLYTKFG